MKRVNLFLIMALAVATASFAQSSEEDVTLDNVQNAKGRHKAMLDRMSEALDLTEEQKTSIRAINQKKREEVKVVLGGKRPKKGDEITEEQKAQIKEIRKQRRKEVSEVLTEEQLAKWKTMKKAARKGRKERRDK